MVEAYIRAQKMIEDRKSAPVKGQGMVEYALILVAIAVVVMVVLATMGGQIVAQFNTIVTALGG